MFFDYMINAICTLEIVNTSLCCKIYNVTFIRLYFFTVIDLNYTIVLTSVTISKPMTKRILQFIV